MRASAASRRRLSPGRSSAPASVSSASPAENLSRSSTIMRSAVFLPMPEIEESRFTSENGSADEF